MKILDFLNPKAIRVGLTSTNKEDVINELIDILISAGDVKKTEKTKIANIIRERENLGSTGIGQNIGIPHGKCDCVKKLTASFGVSKKGVDFDSLDGEPVYLFFLLIASKDSAGPHLKGLARISRLLKDKFFRDALRNAKDEKEILKLIKDEDGKKG